MSQPNIIPLSAPSAPTPSAQPPKGWWARFKASLRMRLQAWLLKKLAQQMEKSGAAGPTLPMSSQITLGGKVRTLNSYNASRVAVSRALQQARK